MTDFLASLVDRSFGAAAAIRPRVAFLFEPALPHGGPSADVAGRHEAESANVAQERVPARAAFERRDEPAPDRTLASGPERAERATSKPTEAPGSRTDAPLASALPAPVLQMTRRPVEQETKRTERDPAVRDSREDKATHRDETTPVRSAESIRPVLAEAAAIPRTPGRDEERSLLVPSKAGARIAADLQSSVSAASVRTRDRGTGPQRASETVHASAERNVHVTIGRIEVRATGGSDKTPARERPASPVMGLDEYLRRQARRGGQ